MSLVKRSWRTIPLLASRAYRCAWVKSNQ